jgi:LmbE family N-acetylglucosaminyl deacetylase
MKTFNYQRIRKLRYLLLAAFAIASIIASPRTQQTATASQQPSEDRVALYQALLDLTNPWTVMCIAAHPDDEDGTSLIVMRRKYGAHTVSLFSTFGEGGQNAIGPELYEEMGAIRARETMAAAEIQGSEPHFLGLKDFGYSKSADEAFKFWGHEEALRRMVLEIRKLRPDVIITNHSVTSNDHGHHQATARLEVEAFDAAADPTKFPEQLKDGVTVWQVQRLFVRARGNQAPGDTAPIVTIDPNERDPIRGVVYAEEALRALQKHATQGPWPKTFAEYATRFRAFSGQQGGAPGQLPPIRYRLTREAKAAAAVSHDSHNFLDGLRLPKEIADEIEVPTITSDGLMQSIETRQLTQDVLIKGYRRGLYGLSSVNEQNRHRPVLMRDRLERAIAVFAGVNMDVDLAVPSVIPGSSATVAIHIKNSGAQPIDLLGCSSSLRLGSEALDQVNDADVAANTKGEKIDAGSMKGRTIAVDVPAQTPINVPLSNHLYEPSGLGIQIDTRCRLDIENTDVNIRVQRRTDVAPQVEIAGISPSALVMTPQTENVSRTLTLQVINHEKNILKTSIETIGAVDHPESNRKRIAQTTLTIGAGEKRELEVTLPMEVKREMVARRVVTVVIPRQSPTPIPEPTPPAPAIRLLFRATQDTSNEVAVPFVFADARVTPNLRVGYIRGFDFSLPNALAALGVKCKELRADEVKTGDLSKYTSIIVDNRVYESQPELIAANQKLLDYANAGGTLIVFYHKSNEWNPDERRKRPQLAPYKLILGDERITDENAPITFLEPQHTLLNSPNKLGQEDFVGWIQERGLYYPKDWDPQFHALLQSNDPGEAPLKGGLLVADYGRGHYIYTSMVWYRELRGGVPGAYRMLANMISYGRAK